MAEFKLTIELGNDEMQGPDDIAAALEKVVEQVRDRAEYPKAIIDANGNTVGCWLVTP